MGGDMDGAVYKACKAQGPIKGLDGNDWPEVSVVLVPKTDVCLFYFISQSCIS
jgi:hypothetical protein